MVILRNLFMAVVGICALLAAIGGPTPTSAQSARPAQDVSAVNASCMTGKVGVKDVADKSCIDRSTK